VFYDFNKPEDIPEKFNGYFDLVLIDPPFITLDVWSKYAEAAKKIVKKDENGGIVGKIVGCSIEENAEMLQNLLGLQKKAFKPSIPNLIYQYTFYSNYESSILGQKNPEIDDS
jgi:16S rRNA G966 N2-methylase RsmD